VASSDTDISRASRRDLRRSQCRGRHDVPAAATDLRIVRAGAGLDGGVTLPASFGITPGRSPTTPTLRSSSEARTAAFQRASRVHSGSRPVRTVYLPFSCHRMPCAIADAMHENGFRACTTQRFWRRTRPDLRRDGCLLGQRRKWSSRTPPVDSRRGTAQRVRFGLPCCPDAGPCADARSAARAWSAHRRAARRAPHARRATCLSGPNATRVCAQFPRRARLAEPVVTAPAWTPTRCDELRSLRKLLSDRTELRGGTLRSGDVCSGSPSQLFGYLCGLTTSRGNCGMCGNACPTGQNCIHPRARCDAGAYGVRDACVTVSSDVANCGMQRRPLRARADLRVRCLYGPPEDAVRARHPADAAVVVRRSATRREQLRLMRSYVALARWRALGARAPAPRPARHSASICCGASCIDPRSDRECGSAGVRAGRSSVQRRHLHLRSCAPPTLCCGAPATWS